MTFKDTHNQVMLGSEDGRHLSVSHPLYSRNHTYPRLVRLSTVISVTRIWMVPVCFEIWRDQWIQNIRKFFNSELGII